MIFDVGDVVTAGGQFSGTVVGTDGRYVTVENRDGETETFEAGDLKYTA